MSKQNASSDHQDMPPDKRTEVYDLLKKMGLTGREVQRLTTIH